MSLYGCLYSHKNYIQHKFFSKIKYCSLSDFIIAVMGKSNRCEIEGVWNLFPTPSLKLGSDWDSRPNPPPLTAIIKMSVVFSHTTTIHSQIVFHLYKRKKESFGLKCIQRMSLYGCLYSHKNYIQHKSISKEKRFYNF